MLVTGATGAIGPRVVQALHVAGYRIRTFSLDKPQPGWFPANIETITGDINDSLAIRSALQGVELVIHMAALLHIVGPSPALREKYERTNFRGTEIVVDAAVQAGIKRLVFFSTIAVYGNSQGKILTEDSPPRPDSFYAQSKLAAERIILDAKRADGKNLGTVLRLAAVYGARVKGNYLRLLQALARGRFIPVGNGTNRRTLIYDRDVATAVLLAARSPKAGGRIYNVSDGYIHTLNEIIETMCESLGRTPPRFSLPVKPVRLAAGILEECARFLGRQSPIVRATVNKYTEDIAVSSQRIQMQLGFEPQYDLLTGWRETVREMKKLGDL